MSDYHPPKGGPDDEQRDQGQPQLREPKHLKDDDPGPCPRPPGCKCRWTAGTLGWFHGRNEDCPVH